MLKFEKVKINKALGKKYRVEQSYRYLGDDYWDWNVWIDSDDQAELSKISSVTYHLHNTFPNPVISISNRRTKFKLKTSGWGTFTMYVILNLKDGSVIELSHDLILEYPVAKGSRTVAEKK
jgi:transcription initiation factor IIF auxiliary subunit